MPMTVRELTEVRFLRTRVIAGAAGVNRPISWAHCVEMVRPWEWLEVGDLLMTVGLGLPADPGDQVGFVQGLAAAGVSGVTIGGDRYAPPLSGEMLAAADELGLPVLRTAHQMPFVQISRTVAAANQDPVHLRVVKMLRIYDSVRAAASRSSSAAQLMRDLGDELDCDLLVCTNDRGTPVFPESPEPAEALREPFLRETGNHAGGGPGILRLAANGTTALVIPVLARRPASLLVLSRGPQPPEYAILQHVATIAALELERLLTAREERRRLGSETLAQLLDRQLSATVAASQLQPHGLDNTRLLVTVAVSADNSSGRDDHMHHALAERGIAHMLLRRDDVLCCLTAADDAVVDEAAELLAGEDLHVGISDVFVDLGAFGNAVREARWAAAAAASDHRRIARYGQAFHTSGPRSLDEARAVVRRHLGPLIDYDRDRGSVLVHSLAVFLRCNRSWQQAASELFVHKQTLIYRMRRVEELLGRKLTETATIAELWTAISALHLAE